MNKLTALHKKLLIGGYVACATGFTCYNMKKKLQSISRDYDSGFTDVRSMYDDTTLTKKEAMASYVDSMLIPYSVYYGVLFPITLPYNIIRSGFVNFASHGSMFPVIETSDNMMSYVVLEGDAENNLAKKSVRFEI
jgi:hypothetical protein